MSRTVLLCRVDGNFGGVERFILSLLRHLDREAYTPVVVPIWHEEELARQARELGAAVEPLPMRSRLDLRRAARGLAAIAEKHEASLLHTFGLRSNTLAHFLGKRLPLPWIIRLPNINSTDYANPVRGWFSHWFNNRLIRHANALQVISPQLEEYVLSWRRPPRVIYTIPNGVELRPAAGEGMTVRQQYGIPAFAPVIGSMGRLEPIKGFDLLLRAYGKIVRKYPEARLMLIGQGRERQHLQRLSRQLALPHAVIFTGFQNDPIPYLAALDAYVCASHSEGVPNALLEAMGLGVPVLSTRVGGIESLLVHNENGLLIEPGHVDAIYVHLDELLQSEAKRSRLGQAARHTIESGYSAHRMASQVQTMYDDVIEKFYKRGY